MNVARWGNSLAIRLPASIVRLLDLHEGDEVSIDVVGDKTLEIERTPSIDELIDRLRRFEGRLPKDFKFDRLEANAR